MATKKKLLQAAAGAAGGAGLNVEEVFSTYLYEGTGATQTITNGIDLDGEGGLVWSKARSIAYGHYLDDTERGIDAYLSSHENREARSYGGSGLTAFNSNGFSMGNNVIYNASGKTYASWTFRKAPKFFDVVTYDGNSTAGRTISHDLGCEVGMILVKCTTNTTNWMVYHRGADATAPEDKYLRLNMTSGVSDSDIAWNDTAPTSTEFTLGSHTLVNGSGQSYVAYLFAHNDGDGEFGPNSDQDIIKCGSFSATGSAFDVDLGFEPQFILFKRTDNNGDWRIYDTFRGWLGDDPADNAAWLKPNSSSAEVSLNYTLYVNSSGFTVTGLGSSGDYVYVAIRRGPMAVPDDADDVFDIDTRGGTSPSPPELTSGFVTDFLIYPNNINTTNDKRVLDRLRGSRYLYTNKTDAETAGVGEWDYMDGHGDYSNVDSNDIGFMWKRAPNYFDVVCYTGNGTAGRTVSHNLGVAPEMMWVKNRADAVDWWVYHKDTGATKRLYLNQSYAALANSTAWNDTAPTDSVFTVGTSSQTNGSGDGMIAYLFASLDGVSKVGSYTGNGTSTSDSQNIDCGFTNGARFVLVKKTSGTGSWMFFDTERGIVTGNDGTLALDTSLANNTGADPIDPYNAGFTINWAWSASDSYNPNANGAEYIFYAIA